MEEVYRVANEYYTKLESFKGTQPYKCIYFWLTILCASLFIYLFFSFMTGLLGKEIKGIFNTMFAAVLVSELIMLFFLFKLSEWKNNLNLDEIKRELNTSFDNRKEARPALLESYLSCSRHEFSEVALRLQKMLDITYLYSNEPPLIDRVFNFIYNKEAHTRVLTLFVVFCSIITALSISSGQNLASVIEAFSETTGNELLNLFITVLGITLVVRLGIIQLYTESKQLLIAASLNLSSKKSRNIEAVKYLINDLNTYHQFKIEEKKLIILSP